jgi:hypothetical protein
VAVRQENGWRVDIDISNGWRNELTGMVRGHDLWRRSGTAASLAAALQRRTAARNAAAVT